MTQEQEHCSDVCSGGREIRETKKLKCLTASASASTASVLANTLEGSEYQLVQQ